MIALLRFRGLLLCVLLAPIWNTAGGKETGSNSALRTPGSGTISSSGQLPTASKLTLRPPLPPSFTGALWLGGTGNWTDAGHWSIDPLYPQNDIGADSHYSATINGGTVTLDANITIDLLTLDAATLTGGANLTLLDGGGNVSVVSGAASIQGTGFLTLDHGAMLAFTDSDPKVLTDRWLTLPNGSLSVDLAGGTLSVGGTGHIGGDEDFGEIDLVGSGTIAFGGGTPGFTSTAGLFKSGAGVMTIDLHFALPEFAEDYVEAGTLRLTRGGTLDGLLDVAAGAVLELDGAAAFYTSATTDTFGQVRIRPGVTLNVVDDSARILAELSGGTTEIDGAVITGPAFSAITLLGATTWKGVSAMTGAGRTIIQGYPFATTDNALKTITDRQVVIDEGEWDFAPAGGTLLVGGAAVIDTGSGEFKAIGDGTIGFNGGTPLFYNGGGILSKSGVGTTTTIGIHYTEDGGGFDLQSGALRFTRGGDFTGESSIADGARLELDGTATFSMSGYFFGSDTAEVWLHPGVALTIDGGELDSLTLRTDGATVSGNGECTCNDVLWTGAGTITVADFIFGGSSAITDNATKTLTNSGMSMNGALFTFAPAGGTLRIGGTSVLTNGADEFNADGNGTIAFDGGTPHFDSTTLFTKTGPGSATTVDIVFNNSGVVAVKSGTLGFSRGYLDSGELDIAAGAGVAISAAPVMLDGILRGSGTLTSSVPLTSSGVIAPGDTVGTLTVAGSLTLTASSQLEFELGPVGASDRLVVTGNVTVNGVLEVGAFPGFGAGSYALIQYTGTWADNGLTLGSVPAGFVCALFHDSASKQLFLLVDQIQSIAVWRTAQFGTNAGNPVIAGPLADPDNDGVENLIEYAFGLDPLTPGILPIATAEEGGYLTLTYTWPKGRPGANCVVEVAFNAAGPWDSGAGFTQEVSVTDNGLTETVKTRSAASIASASPQFLRVRVTATP